MPCWLWTGGCQDLKWIRMAGYRIQQPAAVIAITCEKSVPSTQTGLYFRVNISCMLQSSSDTLNEDAYVVCKLCYYWPTVTFLPCHVCPRWPISVESCPNFLCENTVLSTLSIHLMILVLHYRHRVHGEWWTQLRRLTLILLTWRIGWAHNNARK